MRFLIPFFLLCVTTSGAGFGNPGTLAMLKAATAAAGYPSGATHYWAMEQASNTTRTDSVGSLNFNDVEANCPQGTGKNNNCVTVSASGLECSAFQLGSAFSVVFWFKATVGCDPQDLIWQSNGTGLKVGYSTATEVSATVDGGATYLIGDNASSGAWHLVVVTYSGTTLSLSVDGAAFDTGTQTFANDSSTMLVVDGIGGVSYDMDEVATFTRALTITEVGNIWNGGTGRFGP